MSPWILLAGACHCGPAPESGETSDPGHSGDSAAETGLPNGTLWVTPTLPEDVVYTGDATLSLVHVIFGEGPRFGETMASEPLSLDGVQLALPWPAPAEHAVLLSPRLGIEGALYALVAYLDGDGDGGFQEGERLLGIAMDHWVLLVHSIPEDHEDTVVNTWRVVDLGIAGQYEPNRCALDSSWPLEWMMDRGYPVYEAWGEPIPLPLRGLEASLEVAGAITDLPGEGLRLAALPYPHLGEREVSPWIDQALALDRPRFEGRLEGEPPPEDDVGSDPDWRYTMHLLLAYTDSDASGGFSLEDPLEGASACLEGELAWPRYTRTVSSYRGYRFLDCYGGTAGWRLARYADHGGIEYLSREQAGALELDFTDCRLD
jgi:hypothetical protein